MCDPGQDLQEATVSTAWPLCLLKSRTISLIFTVFSSKLIFIHHFHSVIKVTTVVYSVSLVMVVEQMLDGSPSRGVQGLRRGSVRSPGQRNLLSGGLMLTHLDRLWMGGEKKDLDGVQSRAELRMEVP